MSTTRAEFPKVGPYKEKGSKSYHYLRGSYGHPPPHPREPQAGGAEGGDHSALDFGLDSHVPLLILAVLGSMKQAKQDTRHVTLKKKLFVASGLILMVYGTFFSRPRWGSRCS